MSVRRAPGLVLGTDNADFYVLIDDDVNPADKTVNLFGLRGDDELGAGNVTGHVKIFGGEGNDRITAFNNNRALSIYVYGGKGDDIITGREQEARAGGTFLRGDRGNDEIRGDDAFEIINGGKDNDKLDGGAGDDKIYGDEGNDILVGGLGADELWGGAGNDVANSSSSLTTPDAGDVINGEAGDDKLWGTGGNDVIMGGDGQDVIEGGDGADKLQGNDGDDNIKGGAGADEIEGGSGNDRIDGELGADLIYGNDSDDTIYGGEYCEKCPIGPDDTIYGGKGSDWIYGESGDDLLYGESDNDHIFGGEGNDIIDGGLDDDDLFGGAGNDVIYGSGSASEDRIAGGIDNDVLFGGPGNDSFRGGPGIDQIYLNSVVYFGAGTPAADAANDIVAYHRADVKAVAADSSANPLISLTTARSVADTVFGFVPGTIVSAAGGGSLPVGVATPGSTIVSTPGEDQFLIDPSIAPNLAGVGYWTTITNIGAVGNGGLEISQFVTPDGRIVGSLLWVDSGPPAPGVNFLSDDDTIIAWVEGALVTPADIVFGVSDLPA